jgi:urease accessory protein
MHYRFPIALVLLAVSASPALAHLDPAEHGSFAAGFTHPLFGLDHVLAMVAVGLWATMLGGRAIWLVPMSFVGLMALGFLVSAAGVPLPYVEPLILASVVAIGLMIAIAAPVPVWLGAAIVGFFAIFHGHAHGGEIGEATAVGYAAGFAIATALLHSVGIAVGMLLGRALPAGTGTMTARLAGGATALAGMALIAAG